MLIRYQKSYGKIAMGLLSYMPDEDSVKGLQEQIKVYETDASSELYLWKVGDDFIGLLGIDVSDELYTVKDIAVNPSFRGEGIGREMVKAIQKRYPDKKCQSTEMTDTFLQRCVIEKNGGAED